MTTLARFETIPEYRVEGKRLGRHVWHDERSRSFPYAGPAQITSALHIRHIPILDQGDLGSCTGNAEVGALATDGPYQGLPVNHPELDEAEAVHIYSRATSLDGFPGTWPPDDTGSDGISVCKAAKADGLISGYTHCFDLNTALGAVSAGPVLFGFNWYDSFDSPDSAGLVKISPGAQVRGGHEIVARGVDVPGWTVLFDNSWSEAWGDLGSFTVGWDDLARLLAEDGDATVPLPAHLPPPVPLPATFAGEWNTGQPGGVQAWCRQVRTRPDLVTLKAQLQAAAQGEGLPL